MIDGGKYAEVKWRDGHGAMNFGSVFEAGGVFRFFAFEPSVLHLYPF